MAQTIKFSNSGFRANVSRNAEFAEWQARFYSADGSRIRGADYFTDDKSDALQTAQYMLQQMASRQNAESSIVETI